jgi:ornithine cyclodeaminase/alanine dehydrogenase-like protein (mu-crystallin family)
LEVLLLTQEDVRALLDPLELIAALDAGFRALSAGELSAADRTSIANEAGDVLLTMPGALPDSDLTVKLVTLFERNQPPFPTHQATIALFDRATGACRALLDGTYVTALRTAATAALAARELARADARRLLVVGSGVQAREHLAALPLVRDLREITVWARRREAAQALGAPIAEDLEAAVRAADVIALTTGAGEPVIDADWVRPGAHVSSVGFHPPRGELPRALAERGHLFVESRTAFAPPPVGCGELAGLDPQHGTEIGELLAGSRAGRRSDEEITVYKAMGHVVEDVVAAGLAHRRARERGVGRLIDL